MSALDFIALCQWFFLGYFVLLNLSYILLNLLSIGVLRSYMASTSVDRLRLVFSELEPPVSLLVPAYNEAATIVSSLRSLLQQNYPEFEIIVVNDGSKDETLQVLTEAFQLAPYPETREPELGSRPVRAYYRSRLYPQLRVVDKENGGKADSINAGINAAEYPLFCAMDADSILQRDSLLRVVQPFLMDPEVLAAGGTIRAANGCEVRDGFLLNVDLPRNLLALFQIIEYMRAFLFGRIGWTRLNSLLIISGAFGVFRRKAVVSAGGYDTATLGEDMELVMRLHRVYRAQKRPYRITFVPDPVCWTEVPQDFKTLARQRARWHRGLSESLWWNRGLLFSLNGGMPGWVGFPYAILFEWLSPVVELVGYLFMLMTWLYGLVSLPAFLAFLLAAVGLGVLLSVTAILLEEMSFHTYPKPRHIWVLLGVAVLENFGFRQLTAVWRLQGLFQWLFRRRAVWGTMKRSGAWAKTG